MKGKCTDPKQWGAAAEPNFSEDRAEAYISHLRECPFHAEVEKRSQEKVGSLVEIVRSRFGEKLLVLRREEEARIREILAKWKESCRSARIKELLISVNGTERVLVDLCKENRLTIEVSDSALISIWKPREGDEEEDLYLTAYSPSNFRCKTNGARRHSVTLEGGQILGFEVGGMYDSRALVTVSYYESEAMCPVLCPNQ